MTNKMDEIVFAVPVDKLFNDGELWFHGALTRWTTNKFNHITNNIVENYVELERGECEYDPFYKHLIPYVVLRAYNGFYFVTKRTENQTEARLHNKLSLGVGGHVGPNPAGAYIDEALFGQINLGMRRELVEELCVINNTNQPSVTLFDIVQPRLIGLINDDSNPVGKVHLGLLYIATVRPDQLSLIGIRETENMSSLYANRQYCLDNIEAFEGWSQIIINSGEFN